jgi:RNA polymerase sigma-70 factor (ECF subfamily)
MTGPPDPDQMLSALIGERRQLLNLAYRLLGSLTEAEDVVQETYARWYAMSDEQQQEVVSPGAWLTTVSSRICLDLLSSARVRRERYVGAWIPEPVPGPSPDAADPAERVTLDESINMAFLVVLESMTPAERVAFILHDVFRYPFAEVAEIVGRTPGACRQLASSARSRLRAVRSPATAPAEKARVIRDFRRAWETYDIDALVGLLDPDVVAISDGGGLAAAGPTPTEGGLQVARRLLGFITEAPGMRFMESVVNGQPGLVVTYAGAVSTVMAFDVADDRITRIWAVRNPEKLRLWTATRND